MRAERAHAASRPWARRSVGYGLADFKLKLAGSVNERRAVRHRAVDEDDKTGRHHGEGGGQRGGRAAAYRNAAASQGHRARHQPRWWRAGRERAAASSFYGVGNSGIVAQDAQHKFFRLGMAATAVSDGHCGMSATTLEQATAPMIISNSGRSKDLLDVA